RKELHARGYFTPLVADIHFTPNAAEWAARIVEKVRVNPGNYADKKKFENIDYSDAGYQAELDRIRDRFTPLVKICKEYGTAMRIGTNHGSLSDRILSRYGDTPLGMVESALEFLRICEDNNYFNIVLSMKSSNPQVMVQAYRLLISKMREENMNYPLHLGVTEAGEGEDGRIKSATGIGTLLEDGIGDTIRVSLTEDPEFEIPVAKMLVDRYTHRNTDQKPIPPVDSIAALPYSPFEYHRRTVKVVENIGEHQVPRVVADFSHKENITAGTLFPVGYNYSVKLDKWNLSDQACDYIYTKNKILDFEIPGTLGIIVDANFLQENNVRERHYPFFNSYEQFLQSNFSKEINFIRLDIEELLSIKNSFSRDDLKNVVFVFESDNVHGMVEIRRMFIELMYDKNASDVPVIIKRNYTSLSNQELQIHASTDAGALLLDGFGDGVWINTDGKNSENTINALCFGILQASRTRISKTEYISCPSCGRTLFDLQDTTAKIRSRTDHLKGIKIGIMGCIVNGPGEMADADYGYVGTGPGKITLYKGQTVVKRNVPEERAVDALIELIRENGDWVELKSPSEVFE
ncbi:MAG TPA: flavodoxin-dependent (E)-4-hydroxy-3-methylbut-2-enyl-diphosphate synthase, partial [Bacteroidia bacterium]|nr:flavodoxin-dependent (E)-4-hydroxy-3-methylbut-2-enyl-diphosphate synthase [Bacteroidia bacterium]